uniref:Secreted protein n=1 Tax=Cacopsylla melanoneura TaxID=428564 RepID=A0A8D9B8C5_9HEMI
MFACKKLFATLILFLSLITLTLAGWKNTTGLYFGPYTDKDLCAPPGECDKGFKQFIFTAFGGGRVSASCMTPTDLKHVVCNVEQIQETKWILQMWLEKGKTKARDQEV